jgi:hypothetical protein
LFVLRVLFALFAITMALACSTTADSEPMPDASAPDASGPEIILIDIDSGEVVDDREPLDASTSDGSVGEAETCEVRVEQHPRLAGPHIGAPLPPSAYNSSPPSSGPHCDQWAQLTTFTPARPLPACYFLHNLEHASVALLYNCPDGCTELAESLEQVKADSAADPDCTGKRVLITPYADMDAMIAAAAWGFTWTSDCPELFEPARESLLEFIAAHLGSNGLAPEPRVCGDGAIAP